MRVVVFFLILFYFILLQHFKITYFLLFIFQHDREQGRGEAGSMSNNRQRMSIETFKAVKSVPVKQLCSKT